MTALSDLHVILIGGSSHAGKSTFGRSLAAALGWNLVSTDKLARHPGRPWKTAPQVVPEHVAKHYLSLEIDELVVDVIQHYRANVGPLIPQIVNAATDAGVVIEGSAVMPELIRHLDPPGTLAFWLTAPSAVFERRIRDSSDYEKKCPLERTMIDKFIARTQAFDQRLRAAAIGHGFNVIDTDLMRLPDDPLAVRRFCSP